MQSSNNSTNIVPEMSKKKEVLNCVRNAPTVQKAVRCMTAHAFHITSSNLTRKELVKKIL